MEPRHIIWDMLEGKTPLPPAEKSLGMKSLSCTPESGRIELAFIGQTEWCNILGNIGGGYISAVLDCATSLAPATCYEHNEFGPTTELKIQFIRACRPGVLKARAWTVERTDKSAISEGELYDETGELVAKAIAYLRIIRIDKS